MTLKAKLKASALVVAVAAMALPSLAAAQSVADFYKSKNLRILVGSGAGGGYDTYARLIARHWTKYIPGNPTVIVQNMPGAGGLKAHNHLATKAARDGSVIAATRAAMLVESLLDVGNYTKFDARTDNWIGNVSPQQPSCLVWHTSPVKTLQDAMNQEVIFAAGGARSNGATLPNIFNKMIGTKFKVITGYSTAGTRLALERGEAAGLCYSYANVQATQPNWIAENKIRWLIQMGVESTPEQKGVPVAIDFAKTDDDKKVIQLMVARQTMGRPYVAPPNVPADRLAALRSSFMKTVTDKDFLREAKKLKLQTGPSDYKAVTKVVMDAHAMPSRIIKKTQDLLAYASSAAKKAKSIKKKKKKAKK
jgi:tripartite-type tricarboxylate transporter receptor subunit TctC